MIYIKYTNSFIFDLIYFKLYLKSLLSKIKVLKGKTKAKSPTITIQQPN